LSKASWCEGTDNLKVSQPQAFPKLTYLDNAATSFPKPPEVVEAVRACLGQSLTVQRSTHVAPFHGDEVMRRCRVKVAKFICAQQPEEIVYAYSATDALNIAIHGLVKPGSHVLVSPLEHHSVMRPLHSLRRNTGVEFETLQADAMGVVDLNSLRQALKPDSVVIINWISNVSGTVQPVVEIGAICRELGVPFVVDASQATGSHSVDVRAVGCDAMAQPAHKALFSLPGLGILYVRKGAELAPWRIGGTGYRSDLLEQPEEMPMRLESGTPNVPAIVGLEAALDWFERTGIGNVQQHCADITATLWTGLHEIDGVQLIGPPPSLERGFVVSFNVGGTDPLVISQVLSENYGVSSRAGLHCAPTAHRFFGTYDCGGTVRFSVGYFTTQEHVDAAVAAVREIAAAL
jgi:cysteine desulfurase family protein